MKEGKSVTKQGLSSKEPVNYVPVKIGTGQRPKPLSQKITDKRGTFERR